MKKISKLTITGLTGGFLFSLFSAIRYFLIWQDTDKALVYVIIGILIMSVSWLYWMIKSQGYTLSSMEEYLADRK